MTADAAPVLIIGDEQDADAATKRQMAQTAARFGVAGPNGLPSSARPIDTGYLANPRAPQVIPLPPLEGPTFDPVHGFAPGANQPLYQTQPPLEGFLLLTSTAHGSARAVKMQGSAKAAAWPMSQAAADVIGQVLEAFGIRVVDLRDDSEGQESTSG